MIAGEDFPFEELCEVRCCPRRAESGKSECFHHRIKGISFGFRGSAKPGRKGWNQTATEWKLENFGTASDKELAARGIERADKT